MRRGDVPFITPTQCRYKVGPVAGDHRHTHCDAIGFVDRYQIGIHAWQIVGRHACSREILTYAARQQRAVARHALTAGGNPDFVLRRCRHHGEHRKAIRHQCH